MRNTKNILKNCIKNSYATFQNYNNEIGLPLCALELDSKNSTAIFEMGAAKLGDIDLLSKIIKPNIGIITHIGHSHLDGLNSVRGVLEVKSELINNIKKDGAAIVPDSKYLVSYGDMDPAAAAPYACSGLTAFSALRMIVTVGWAIYPIGYFLGYLSGGEPNFDTINVVYNIADLVNKTAFGLAIWVGATMDSSK